MEGTSPEATAVLASRNRKVSIAILDWLRRLLAFGLAAWVSILLWREHWLIVVLLGPMLYVFISGTINAFMIPLYKLATRKSD